MPIKLPDLPYDKKALEPYMSGKTLSFHYEKHHQGYVTNLNKAISGTELDDQSLEDLVKKSDQNKKLVSVFNNAAQVWNHTFYWNSLSPQGGVVPTGQIATLINQSFGGYEAFKEQFKEAAIGQFGSGWAWLVKEKNRPHLKIQKTGNAETPLVDQNVIPLLTCDVWEHAYYLDYQNRRMDYVDVFLTHLINWSFAEKNLRPETA